MNKKFSTLVAVLLAAGAWTTLEAKVVEVAAPQIGNAYVIGTDVVNGKVATLLKADGTATSEATDATAAEVWTLEAADESNFYLKNSKGEYLIFDTNKSSEGFVGYSTETTNSVKFKLDGNKLLVAEQVPSTGNSYFKVNDAFTLTAEGAKVDYNADPEATELAFALYTSEEVPAGMPGLEEVITENGKVNKETLTADITVPAPFNIKAGEIYLSVTTDDNGNYVLVTKADDQVKELNASNSLAASWEWRNGYLVSTAASRADKPAYLTYDSESETYGVAYNRSDATNFATENAGIADVTVTVSATSLIADEDVMVDFLNLLNNEIVNIKKADDVKLSVEITLLHYIDANIKKSNGKISETINKPFDNKTIVKVQKEEVSVVSNPTIEEKNVFSHEKVDFSKVKELMLIRARNTMIEALKTELTKEQNNLNVFNDYTFDQNNGYLACELLDGTVRAASNSSIILSYDYESMIEKMYNHIDKLIEFYNKISNNNKIIALITNEEWNNLKNEYMVLRKEGRQFSYQEEPVLNINNNNDKITDEDNNDIIKEAKDLFGDIVEIKED